MTDLTILQLNDLHGYISPHPEFVYDHDAGFRTVTLGGLARIRTLFDRARDENPGGVIALDNGDSFHGTHFAVSDQGEAMAPLLDAVGFDAMTLHWEFAYGPARVRELGAKLRHPMLAANIHDEGDGSLFPTPWTMLERKGRRIAVIGLACPIVDKTMPPSYSEGIRFSIGNEELPGHIRDARADGAELVVVLSHVGFPQDAKLAREVDGIDVLVSGHTHNRTERAVEVNGAVIFQSGCHGSFIGRLDLTLGRDGVESYRHRLIPVSDDLPEDEELSGMMRSAHEAEPDELGEVVGSVEVPLHRYAMLGAPMDDLLLDAVAEAGGTRIAFANGWRYGVPVRAGPVTLEDLWRIIARVPQRRGPARAGRGSSPAGAWAPDAAREPGTRATAWAPPPPVARRAPATRRERARRWERAETAGSGWPACPRERWRAGAACGASRPRPVRPWW